jgi:hypothetical protein
MTSPNVRDNEANKFRDGKTGTSVAIVNDDIELVIKTDEVSKNLSYIGYALIGTADSSATWKIKRIQTIGSITSVQYANGTANFDKIWNNRSTYTYS